MLSRILCILKVGSYPQKISTYHTRDFNELVYGQGKEFIYRPKKPRVSGELKYVKLLRQYEIRWRLYEKLSKSSYMVMEESAANWRLFLRQKSLLHEKVKKTMIL